MRRCLRRKKEKKPKKHSKKSSKHQKHKKSRNEHKHKKAKTGKSSKKSKDDDGKGLDLTIQDSLLNISLQLSKAGGWPLRCLRGP